MGTIFLIAVLELPTEAERIEGKRKSIVVAPQFILADDIRSASNTATLLSAKANSSLDPDRVEVLAVAPF